MFDAGSVIGDRYTLLRRVATGGMGTVWRAEDTLLGRVVAIKVLRSEFLGDAQSRARMMFEARAAAAIDSAFVVRIHDVGEAPSTAGENVPYIVMEFVDGSPLSDVLRREGTLPGGQVAAILRDIALGLAAAHLEGLIHRDIKPANILVPKLVSPRSLTSVSRADQTRQISLSAER
jgi:eukaryotic-like serine/threonine-protein kinase